MYSRRIFIFNVISLVRGTLFPQIGHHDESFFVPAEADDVAKDLSRSFFQSDILSVDQIPYGLLQSAVLPVDQLPGTPYFSLSSLGFGEQHSAFETAIPQAHGPGQWISEGSDLLQRSSTDRRVQHANTPSVMELDSIPRPDFLAQQVTGAEGAGPRLQVQDEMPSDIAKQKKRKAKERHAMSHSAEWKPTLPSKLSFKAIEQPGRGLSKDPMISKEIEAATGKSKTRFWHSSEDDVHDKESPSRRGMVEENCDHRLHLLLKEGDSVGPVDGNTQAAKRRSARTPRKVKEAIFPESQVVFNQVAKTPIRESDFKTAATTTREARKTRKKEFESKTATKTRKVKSILAEKQVAEHEGSPINPRTSLSSTPPAPVVDEGILIFDSDLFEKIKGRSLTSSSLATRFMRLSQRDFVSFCRAYMNKKAYMRFHIEESKANSFFNNDYRWFISRQQEKLSGILRGSETSHHRTDGAEHGVRLLLENERIFKSLHTQEILARKDKFSQTLSALVVQAVSQEGQSGPAEWRHEAVLRAEPVFLFLVKLINTIVPRAKQYDANWIEEEQTRAWGCFTSFWKDVGFTDEKLNAPDTRSKYLQNPAITRVQTGCFNTTTRKRNIFGVAWGLVAHWLRTCRCSFHSQLKYKPGPNGGDISPRFMNFFNNLIRFTADDLVTVHEPRDN